jgi:hypothetical protein
MWADEDLIEQEQQEQAAAAEQGYSSQSELGPTDDSADGDDDDF